MQSVNGLDDFFYFVIENKHKSPPRATEHVGEGALEEGSQALRGHDLPPAVQGVSVLHIFLRLARLHHHPSPHCVKWVRQEARQRGYSLKSNKYSPNSLTSYKFHYRNLLSSK